MKNKLFYSIFFIFLVSVGFSQNAAEKYLIGEWFGPRDTKLVLSDNAAGYMDLGELNCSMKIISWSATTTELNIHWDMTPIECLKLNSVEKFLYHPKIEFDKPEYTLTRTKSSISGLTTWNYTLALNNKEFSSSGTYFRAEVEQPDE
jgi:hypothetical protein